MAAVNWFWMLLLAFLVGGYLNCSQCIQVTPDAAINNATNSFAHSRNATAGAIASDSELSASERNRRLIPYMAFYLPPDFPINQQYAIQRHKQNQHNAQQQNYHNHPPPSTAIESAGVGPIPPPAHIPIPTAYVQHTKVPSSDAELEYPPHYQPPSAGEVYHTIAYGGSSGGGAGGGRHPTAIGNKIPILHLLPPGPPGAGPHSPYKEIRQKTVQHFPPTPPTTTVPPQYQHQHAAEAQHQHLQQQQQQQAYRLRPKQSKNSLTPFTPSNTLPGHFVPIIYTPVRSSAGSSSSSSSIDQHGNNNGNTINYNYDTDNPTITVEATVAADEEEIQLQQQQHQHQYKSSHKQPQQQHRHQTIVEYPLPPSSAAIAAHLQQQQQQPQLQHQVQFVTVTGAPPSESLATGPATATHPPTSSSIYHVINEASQSFSSAPSQHQQQQSLIAPQQVQQQHYRQNQNHPHFHPPTAENFFDSELRAKQQQQHHQQPQSPPSQLPQYVNADNITPQEKYVMFLQERIRYNKHQQKQRERAKEEHEHEQYHQHKQYQQQQHQSRHQQQQQIFVISTATPPVEHTELVQQQHHSLPETSPQNNYPQHSPIRHAVYSRPELSIPANHQPPNSKALQQVLHIPFRAIVGELDALQQQHQSSGGSSGNAHQKLLQPHYPKSIGPSTPPRYIDYILDEPKQSLDEEQQQHHHNVPHPQIEGKLKPALASPPPHAAYILITTAAPHPQQRPQQQQHQEHYVSTMRPIYKNQPTLQLQPITNNQNYATKRPAISTTLPAIATATPKYVYVPAKPSYSQVLTPTPATKLKPSYKYRVESNDKASPLQAIASPSPSIKYASPTAATKPHQQVEIDERQRQHQQHHHHQYQPHLPPTHSVKSGPHYPSVSTSSRNGEGAHQQQTTSAGVVVDPNQLPDIRSSSLAEILHKLQASNHLPKTLTPDNIDNSIKTLVTILNNLKQTQTIVPNPPQHHDAPPAAADYDYTTGSEEDDRHDAAGAPAPAPAAPHTDLSALSPVTPNKHPGPSTGRPGIDYPNYAEIPQTSFDCAEQRYKGFFGDPETNCQVWHYCDLNGGKASFLCPNGTIFSQIALTCDWWFNVKCSTTAQLYVLNERLYKYILPFTPKFPEDYSGPLVDKYLAMKFQEMEEKMRLDKQQQKQKAIKAATESEVKQNHIEDDDDEEITTLETSSEHDHGHESDSHKHESVNSQVGEQSSERNLLIDDEVDDISQRGSIDTFESTTQATLNSTKEAATVSFSLNPIVVSSTVEPAEDNGGRQNTPKEHIEERNNKETAPAENYQPQKPNEFAVKQQDQQQMQQQHESTKISVEKVEVIEIKSDGTSGHLMPTMYFTTTNEEEKSR